MSRLQTANNAVKYNEPMKGSSFHFIRKIPVAKLAHSAGLWARRQNSSTFRHQVCLLIKDSSCLGSVN